MTNEEKAVEELTKTIREAIEMHARPHVWYHVGFSFKVEDGKAYMDNLTMTEAKK